MGCVDFSRDNPLRLYPGKVNRWLIVSVGGEYSNEALAAEKAKEFVVRKLKGINVDHLNVVKVSKDTPIGLGANAVQRRENLTELPKLATDKYGIWYAIVEFGYYNQAQTIPWPIEGSFLWCDIDELTDMVIAVAVADKQAPEQRTISYDIEKAADKAAEFASDTAKAAGEGLKEGIKAATGGIGQALLIIGAGYLIYKIATK
jgi:hypothetical protein